ATGDAVRGAELETGHRERRRVQDLLLGGARGVTRLALDAQRTVVVGVAGTERIGDVAAPDDGRVRRVNGDRGSRLRLDDRADLPGAEDGLHEARLVFERGQVEHEARVVDVRAMRAGETAVEVDVAEVGRGHVAADVAARVVERVRR